MTDKKQEVAFLADEFDLSAKRAAALVADTADEAETLAADQMQKERDSDPYGDAPVPVSPEEREVEGNGGMQKCVLTTKNEASRTGP